MNWKKIDKDMQEKGFCYKVDLGKGVKVTNENNGRTEKVQAAFFESEGETALFLKKDPRFMDKVKKVTNICVKD